MSNVKPGDLAKIVEDRQFPQNIGAVLLVLEPGHTQDKRMYLDYAGPIWLCEALQVVVAYEVGSTRVRRFTPGMKLVARDSSLRRIDPPADTQELYSTEPTGQELIDELNAKIKEAFNG